MERRNFLRGILAAAGAAACTGVAIAARVEDPVPEVVGGGNTVGHLHDAMKYTYEQMVSDTIDHLDKLKFQQIADDRQTLRLHLPPRTSPAKRTMGVIGEWMDDDGGTHKKYIDLKRIDEICEASGHGKEDVIDSLQNFQLGRGSLAKWTKDDIPYGKPVGLNVKNVSTDKWASYNSPTSSMTPDEMVKKLREVRKKTAFYSSLPWPEGEPLEPIYGTKGSNKNPEFTIDWLPMSTPRDIVSKLLAEYQARCREEVVRNFDRMYHDAIFAPAPAQKQVIKYNYPT